MQWAGRKSKKGRTLGVGIIVGVRVGIKVEKEKEGENKEGIIKAKVYLGER